MVSVTQRINMIKQPYGGYIKPSELSRIDLGNVITDPLPIYNENIHPVNMGLVVDYMSRFVISEDIDDAFKISILGFKNVYDSNLKKYFKDQIDILKQYNGELTDEILTAAAKLTAYDEVYRSNNKNINPKSINPNRETCNHLRIMIERSVNFFNQFGPVTSDGFTFKGGYTNIVTYGDGDFLTKYTLWDFKVSKNPPTSKHTLQLLMYYLMGKKSNLPEFKLIDKIGIFNPRLNRIYYLETKTISPEIINTVETDVIGY